MSMLDGDQIDYCRECERLRAKLRDQGKSAQPAPVVPEGWSASLIKDGDDTGYVVSTPRDETGARSNTSVWADDDDPAHAMLWYMLAATPAPVQHPDDAAVDRFAAAMKAKLAKSRAKGRGGWEDKSLCSAECLSELLRGHVDKGDPVDVANFCMMLQQRGEGIAAPAQQVECQECERLRKLAEAISHDCNEVANERNELRAELSALKAQQVGQEPFGYLADDGGSMAAFFRAEDKDQFDAFCAEAEPLSKVVLYAAPQPAPAQDVAGLVEAASGALAEIQAVMQEDYNSATPVCCGRGISECCGSPDPEWSEHDQRTMDRFAPHELALRAALADLDKQSGEVKP